MSFSSQPGHDRFRILLYRRNGNQLLLERNAQGFALPDVCVPPYTRVAQQINEAVWKDWRLQSFCLFPVGDPNSPAYAVELCGAGSTHPANMNWFPVDSVARRDFPEAQDFHAIETATKLFDQYRNAGAAEPFGKFGWLRDLTEWVEPKATDIGLHLTGNFQQFDAGPTFSLIRLGTDRGAVWFKATGEPNLHELPITFCLARLFPVSLPPILGIHPTWNGWLSEEVSNTTLDQCKEPSAWERAAKSLAELQINSIGKSCTLLDVHCKDLRLLGLIDLVPPFIAHMAELMASQIKESPQPLTDHELDFLGERLHESLSLLHALGLPDTLGHTDLNPGNVLVAHHRCVFLDWAEACLTNPILTFEYLREHMQRIITNDATASVRIATAYLRPWKSLVPPDDLAKALTLSPLIAVFMHALASSAWRSVEMHDSSAQAAYFRSLTRRMYREARPRSQRAEHAPIPGLRLESQDSD